MREIINDKIENDVIYRESEYFINSKVKNIKAKIFYKIINKEFKAIYDSLRAVELKYKDKIKILIETVRDKKMKEEDLYVIFHNTRISNDCNKLDSFTCIIEKILNKKMNKIKNSNCEYECDNGYDCKNCQ